MNKLNKLYLTIANSVFTENRLSFPLLLKSLKIQCRKRFKNSHVKDDFTIIQKYTLISKFISQKLDTVHVNYPILITMISSQVHS